MSAKHLGGRIHDLLDGRLTRERAYTAMAHLGECEECAARWHELREAREALSTAEAGIDMSFAQRLLDKDRIAQIAAQESRSNIKAAAPPDHRPLVAAASVAAVAVILLTWAWALGAPKPVSLEFASDHSSSAATRTVAYMGAQGMRAGDQLRSWIHPDFTQSRMIPVEAEVFQRQNGSNVLVAKLLLGDDVLIVTEEHGRLTSSVQELPRADVDSIDLFVVSEADPAQVVWQTGEVVIALGCNCELEVLERAAAEFPTADAPGLFDRIGDGFEELVDLLP